VMTVIVIVGSTVNERWGVLVTLHWWRRGSSSHRARVPQLRHCSLWTVSQLCGWWRWTVSRHALPVTSSSDVKLKIRLRITRGSRMDTAEPDPKPDLKFNNILQVFKNYIYAIYI
jgi:hypothetical protein